MLHLGLSVRRCSLSFASSAPLRPPLFRCSALVSLRLHYTLRKFPSRSRNHASASPLNVPSPCGYVQVDFPLSTAIACQRSHSLLSRSPLGDLLSPLFSFVPQPPSLHSSSSHIPPCSLSSAELLSYPCLPACYACLLASAIAAAPIFLSPPAPLHSLLFHFIFILFFPRRCARASLCLRCKSPDLYFCRRCPASPRGRLCCSLPHSRSPRPPLGGLTRRPACPCSALVLRIYI